jgi:hypothetical protein
MAKYKRKGCGPRGLGVSPLKKVTDPPKKAFNKELQPLAGQKVGNKEKIPTTYSEPQVKKDDPNVFTDTYNAATGEYNDSSYNPARAKQYEKNAINKYGSLEASREATRINHPSLTKNKKLQKPIIRGGNKLK